MAGSVSVEIRGLEETQKKMEQVVKDLEGPPIVTAMRQAVLGITSSAKRYAPVDTGRLRASITPEVRISGNEVTGVVGSNVKYAPYMELGTKPHRPPLAPIIAWVHRKQMAGRYSVKTRRRVGSKASQVTEDRAIAFLIAGKIARSGTKARKFLEKAIEENQGRIKGLFEATVKRIVDE